jgi:hypothetical protein
MFHFRGLRVWAVVVALISLMAIAMLAIWQKQQPISLRGAVLVQDSDPRKQLPIAGVEVSTSSDLATSSTNTDSSGLFALQLRKIIRRGHPITLHFNHADYRPLTIKDVVQNKLYVVALTPLSRETRGQSPAMVKVTNVRVRYTVESRTEVNVGSAVKQFELPNKGDVPCKGQHPCSPDGRWKATLGSGSLDAGPGNVFRDARVSCIAGPCPFTRIESDDFARAGQTITVSARNWSDTATFLLEAEVFRPMVSQTVHWSYPVIFEDRLSFTLPVESQSVSIVADMNGQTIIFPLGPLLNLSWANCDSGTQNRARVYRCALKPGYQFM